LPRLSIRAPIAALAPCAAERRCTRRRLMVGLLVGSARSTSAGSFSQGLVIGNNQNDRRRTDKMALISCRIKIAGRENDRKRTTMSMDWIHDAFHKDTEFRDLVRNARIDKLVAHYEARGVRFFFIDRNMCPISPPTGYNTDGCTFEGRKTGDIYLDTNGLDEFGLSRVDGFAVRIFHELGHHEAHYRQLNRGCELLAWEFAADIASTLYVCGLPEWWVGVRQAALATHNMEWDEEEGKVCRIKVCNHHQ
jgi:hypothetical protein